MFRATIGNWANYATTLASQVLFAAHFGSSIQASAFAIAFAIALAMAAILANVVQSVALPRLMAPDGRPRLSMLRFLLKLTAAATAVGGLASVLSGPAASLFASTLGLPPHIVAPLLAISAGVFVLTFVATALALVAYALGYRLLPALAPALPSTAMAVGFLLSSGLDAVAVLMIFMLASLAEVLLLVAVLAQHAQFSQVRSEPLRSLTFWIVGASISSSVLPPIERIIVGISSTADVARYNYAARSISSAQAIVTAGVAVAALASWSQAIGRGTKSEGLRQSVGVTSAVSAYALALTAVVFVLMGSDIVALVYQHGHFTSADTRVVTQVILVALAGYVAQGATAVTVSALAAARRTTTVAVIAIVQNATRLVLMLPLGLFFGARGVALAYSIGLCFSWGLSLRNAAKAGLWSLPGRVVRSLGEAALAAAAAIALVLLLTRGWPVLARLLLVGVALVITHVPLGLSVRRYQLGLTG